MALIKKFVYLVVLILALEVVKTVLVKIKFPWSYLASAFLACMQFLFVLAFIYYAICILAFPRFFKNKKWRIIISFLVLIAFCESLFAWYLNNPERMPRFLHKTFEFYYYRYDILQYHKDLSAYNPELFYTLKPGTTAKFRNREFNTTISANSAGLRDDESSLHHPAIICLGDSYGLGWGVEQQETFAQYLEQLSGKKVLNAGMSSYGTAREMMLLKRLDTTALTHVVIQYCSNDYYENSVCVSNNYQLPISSRGAYDSLVSRQTYTRGYFPGKYFLLISQIFLKQKINKLVPLFKMDTPDSDPRNPALDNKLQARIFIDLLSRSSINFKKVKVIVLAVNERPGWGPEFLQQVENLADQPAFQNVFHDNLMVVQTHDMLEAGDWFTMDRHLKAAGHLKLAQKVWQAIREP